MKTTLDINIFTSDIVNNKYDISSDYIGVEVDQSFSRLYYFFYIYNTVLLRNRVLFILMYHIIT